ncbi:hypothetical protein GCM10011348_40760 [Marinobacterium nitratireducens]|uniref:Uncharacterized protein n=1 Tax=Marinobacterium nitratireducens TaxID=518897 RepID=A0A917ZPA3_9GAMM|nr:hypothetical protein [Marinobacterium nitratireducens]GGO87477.1 hypothetical protein GCM10011348_40760 [Marinobacterium nitratireducens]
MLNARTFRNLRILILLLILLVVALNSWLSRIRTTDWEEPLWVLMYPLNGDGRADTQAYIDSLTPDTFTAIEAFFAREAGRYGAGSGEPVFVQLAPQVLPPPPVLPQNPSLFDNVRWSLAMRWWAWRNDTWQGPAPDIRIFMRYYSPENTDRLAHSLGLQKGLIGLVNAFAAERHQGQNNVVAAHELLHTLGATDKYDLGSGLPVWPDGYAEPERVPRYPQRLAEIMGGRVPISDGWALIPPGLDDVVVGPSTASEINWPATAPLPPEGSALAGDSF